MAKKVLSTLTRLRNQSCQGRLKEIVHSIAGDQDGRWILQECQPCPKCFVLARRETGCDHIACRCGCDFCFSCGAPTDYGCLCPYLDEKSREGTVFFAAWLRCAEESPCEWLWEEGATKESPRFISTLGFCLWAAGACIDPPESWDGYGAGLPPPGNNLVPLKWWAQEEFSDFSDDAPPFDDYDGIGRHSLLAQRGRSLPAWLVENRYADTAGHLRKEICSLHSHRTQQRTVQRKAPLLGEEQKDAECAERPHRLPKVRKFKRHQRGRMSQADLL
jgi:hypothetical protein